MVQDKNETLKEILQILDDKGPMTVDDIVNTITPAEVAGKDLSAGILIRKVIKKQISSGKKSGSTSLLRRDQDRNIHISPAGSDWLSKTGQIATAASGSLLPDDGADRPVAETEVVKPGPLSVNGKKTRTRRFLKQLRRFAGSRFFIYSSALTLSVSILALTEMRTSFIQSYLLSDIMSNVSWRLSNSESKRIEFPKHGPFDERLGYPMIPEIVAKLKTRDFEVVSQAVQSPMQYELLKRGIHAIYEEKHQGGLTLLSSDKRAIFLRFIPNTFTTPSNRFRRLLLRRCW